MGQFRTGALLWALILSGCGSPSPVVTYPNGQTPSYQAPNQQSYQPPSQPAPQAPAISQQSPPQQAVRQAPGSFSARFVDRKTGAPIQGLEVTIVGTDQRATTGADGRVQFANVPAGAYYQTLHNDYVQAKEPVPTAAGGDIQLTAMADYQ